MGWEVKLRMVSVSREPVPPGPVNDLFTRLDDLYSKAGRPSMREIARRVGRGHISSSTVHNVMSGSRVPAWDYLEKIVNALGGNSSRDDFHALWNAAWLQQNGAASLGGATAIAVPAQREQPVGSRPRVTQRIWSHEIPPRNSNFTGRVSELDKLTGNLEGEMPPRVQAISGMGGVGKTELATEYIHRNIDKYDIIWWIRAEHHDRIRESLVNLARRLEPRLASRDSSRDRTIAAVLEKLQVESQSWLLVYDNVANPFDTEKYLPASRRNGHVILTLRQRNWPSTRETDHVEVSPFTEAEAISFLCAQVPSLRANDGSGRSLCEDEQRRAGEAGRLAAELGYLPIAIDHAAAYLRETDSSVVEYLALFTRSAHRLFDSQPGSSDPHSRVSGTWVLSNELLTSDARHLFNLCAFFSPEPIASSLFLQGVPDFDGLPGLAEFLQSSQRFRVAANQLHRLSLVKADAARDVIQMHRVVQAVTQGRLREDHVEQFEAYRSAVDALLAKSNPGNPDYSDGDSIYDISLQHLEAEHRFLRSPNKELRALIIDQVRRLHLRGGHVEAVKFGQEALEIWRERHGEEDLQVLRMAVEVAVAMYRSGRVADAHDLVLQIQPLLRGYADGSGSDADTDGFRIFLLCETIHGAILRARSQFREALARDRELLSKSEMVFGDSHARTLNVRNNIALDYRQLGRFDLALEMDQRTFEDRRRTLGPDDPETLLSQNAIARDLRGLGQYHESLNIARNVANAFESVGGRENTQWLTASGQFATALRKAGYHWDALQQREHVLQRYQDYLGDDHMATIAAATNLINDRIAVGDLNGGLQLAIETYDRCQEVGPPHDLLCAAQLNLASALRSGGNIADALTHDRQAMNGLLGIYGDRHPFTLTACVNYATDLARCGRLGEAVQLGRETLEKYLQSLGDSHPDTLIAVVNLALDESAAGYEESAERRLSDAIAKYDATLTLEHPEARSAMQHVRLTGEIEPLAG